MSDVMLGVRRELEGEATRQLEGCKSQEATGRLCTTPHGSVVGSFSSRCGRIDENVKPPVRGSHFYVLTTSIVVANDSE